MQACLQEDFLPFPTSGDVHSPNADPLCKHKSALGSSYPQKGRSQSILKTPLFVIL
jgi:hypothetical protein